MDETARLRVLSLGVLAYHHQVDLTGTHATERRSDSGVEDSRTHVYVLVESSAYGQQQTVQRRVVPDGRMSYSAQQDGVRAPQLIEGVRRHHPTVLEVEF
jgi:hypothetical protein